MEIRLDKIDALSLRWRVVIAAAIVIVTIFFLWIANSLLAAQDEPQLYEGVSLDAMLLRLDKRALDEAYHAQLLKLFGIWLSEGAKDASRFTNGLRIARRSYYTAAKQIAKREQELIEADKSQQEQK
jgi:hypothetical protein